MRLWDWAKLKQSDHRSEAEVKQGKKLMKRLERKAEIARELHKAKYDPEPQKIERSEKIIPFASQR